MTFNEVGVDGTTVSFDRVPNSVVAGDTANFPFTVEVGDPNKPSDELEVEVKAFLYVAGKKDNSIVSSTSTVVSDNDTVAGELSHQFSESENGIYPRTVSPVWIKVELEYFGRLSFTPEETASTGRGSIQVREPEDFGASERFDEQTLETSENTLAETFRDRTPFTIREIEFEDDATYVNSVFSDAEESDGRYNISFEDYPNPTVSIDTAGRFAKHEIIGGTTVRQKIGEDPINLSINGVCKRRTANQIDALRDAKNGKIISDRLPGGNDGLRVQFGSTSTEPMTDGGSADITDGKYLYSFTINVIEVIR